MNLSRTVKRLLLIIALSVIAILVSKSLLSKAVRNLNIEAEKKQQAKAGKPAILPASAPLPEVSVFQEVSGPLSASGNIGVLVESSPAAAENSSAPR